MYTAVRATAFKELLERFENRALVVPHHDLIRVALPYAHIHTAAAAAAVPVSYAKIKSNTPPTDSSISPVVCNVIYIIGQQ